MALMTIDIDAPFGRRAQGGNPAIGLGFDLPAARVRGTLSNFFRETEKNAVVGTAHGTLDATVLNPEVWTIEQLQPQMLVLWHRAEQPRMVWSRL